MMGRGLLAQQLLLKKEKEKSKVQSPGPVVADEKPHDAHPTQTKSGLLQLTLFT